MNSIFNRKLIEVRFAHLADSSKPEATMGLISRSRFQIQRSAAHGLWYLHDGQTSVTEAHFSWEACRQRAVSLGYYSANETAVPAFDQRRSQKTDADHRLAS